MIDIAVQSLILHTRTFGECRACPKEGIDSQRKGQRVEVRDISKIESYNFFHQVPCRFQSDGVIPEHSPVIQIHRSGRVPFFPPFDFDKQFVRNRAILRRRDG